MRNRRPRSGRGRGFTLIEMALVVSMLGVLMGGFVWSMRRVTGLSVSSRIHHDLAEDSVRVLDEIVADLGRSGYVVEGGVSFPVVFTNGQASGPFASFQHGDPNTTEVAREIIFILPADADGDGWPDISATPAPVWDATRIAYLLVPSNDGSDMLVRQTNAGDSRVMARNVTRLQFDDPAQTGFQIPLDAMRVRIAMRRTDNDGLVYTQELERVVRLQNGGLAP